MTSSKKTKRDDVSLWVLVGLLGLGGLGLFVYGLVQPEPRRNLADPMTVANLAPKPKPKFSSPPSERRRLARARNDKKLEECQWRHDDCSIACDQYGKKGPSYAECMGFCDRARESCSTWANN